MKLLVTGGAGYIGSHMVRMLVRRGVDAVVVDTMEHGYRQALPDVVKVIECNVGDEKTMHEVFSQYSFDGVLHFAGYIAVEESVREPVKYVNNNVLAASSLVNVMAEHSVKNIIFSSTAAVYGNPITVPIPEDHKKEPTSPYGLSKLCFEEYLGYMDRVKGVRSISLRYFNAAGASLDGNFGEAHIPETHILPLALKTALGKQKSFSLYGTDYPTDDGSCMRDYIHLEDLCDAHILAVERLVNGHKSDAYNIGTGQGISNKEVIARIQRVTGVDFSVDEKPRRPGDPAVLVADSTRLQKELGWKPKFSDIQTIVESAWKWHKSHPNGYENRD